jgi:thiamine pyrophosphokinase
MRRHVLLVAGGDPPRSETLGAIRDVDLVICADSGLDHALALGLVPHVVIGDMDSVDPTSLDEARRLGISIVVASPDKDVTDTELAIAHAIGADARSLTVLAGGDRIDHVLGILAAVAHSDLSSLDYVTVHLGADVMHIVHGGRSVSLLLEIGTTLSLLPLAGDAHGVTTSGLRWALTNETLRGSTARGVSNLTSHDTVSVSVEAGVLAVVVPHRFIDEGQP